MNPKKHSPGRKARNKSSPKQFLRKNPKDQ
jgi:hypothetical protein